MLTFSVKNFGPIAEGSVDLKPLTIFVGPSNTGKSYMATAVYAVLKAVPEIGYQFLRLPRGQDWELPDGVLNALWNWVQSEQQNSRAKWELKVDLLPHIVRSWLESETSKQLNAFQSEIIEGIRQLLGETSSFLRSGAGRETFRVAIHQDIPRLDLESRLTGDSFDPPTFDISQFHLPEQMYGVTPYMLLQAKDERARTETASLWCNSISASLFATLPSRSHYLPAGRSAYAESHKVFAAALIRQNSATGTRQNSVSPLPGIVRDLLGGLIGLDSRMGDATDDEALSAAVKFIETKVLHGQIDIDESGGLPFPDLVYFPTEGESSTDRFSLNQSSSMVSELAPLILFLKYLVHPGDLLILEEPESHLHPAAQLQMARGIARLVNAGVQVLITTHSNDFTGQINNLISMSNVSEDTWESLEFEPEECLQPDQVSAYGFRMDPDLGGAVTYPLPVGSDVGIEDEEFLPVIELLYHQAITLQDARLK